MPFYGQELVLENTALFIALAAATIFLLAWRLKPDAFRAIKWTRFALGAGLFWFALASFLVFTFSKTYYSQFLTAPLILIPVSAFIVYPLWGLLLRWLALRLPFNPVIAFCLLGGLQSIPEHAVAIYRFHILELSLMQGSLPAAVFLFAYFEYVVFWGLVLGLAATLNRIIHLSPLSP